MADTTTELEVLDEIVDVLGGQSGQHETVVPVLEDIRDLLSGGGGGGGGYNPSLSVGRADALTGADDTAQWATRESTGSGAATVRSVQGAAVGWNQLINAADSTRENNGVTYVTTDGVMIANGTATDSTSASLSLYIDVVSGHKYFFRSLCEKGSGSTFQAFIQPGSNIAERTFDFGDGAFVTPIGSGTITILPLYITVGTTVTNLKCIPQLFDLTAMFGAGNEPTDLAQLKRMYPHQHYPYSAPTLKPVTIEGIRSTDANGDALDGVEWPTQTLRAAGSVRDELTSDELITRVGASDASSAWFAANTSVNEHGIGYVSLAVDVTGLSFTDVLSSNLPISTGSFVNSTQREFACNAASHMLYYRFPTTAPVTLANALADMQANNAECFYPLATPTTTHISPALPMTYRVQQGGSEAIIVPAGEISAAPVLTIAEGESAAELVMDALACIATPDGPVATSNHAVGTYLTMQGKLYKVTSAIAVGETITAGTNVTETTVMDELIARTA